MSSQAGLTFTIISKKGQHTLQIAFQHLVVAGWVGRDEAAVQKHIEELGKHGVPAPTRTPTYMHLSPNLLTSSESVQVISPYSSGEVESALIRHDGKLYLGVGSDHTDREVEKYDIPTSKQMCAKVLAPIVWEYEEVESHLDEVVLLSWTRKAQQDLLYQEGRLGMNIRPKNLLDAMPTRLEKENLCLFCGTLPTLTGISYGERFAFEMQDPILNRRVSHEYAVHILPQHV